MAIIVPELELRNIERQIFAANLVVATDDAALEDAPEAFNRVRVDRADDVPLGSVVDPLVIVVVQTVVNAARPSAP